MSAGILALIGWIANIFLILSVWRLAYKERWAFLFGVIGSALWAIKAVIISQWDLLSIQLILCSFQFYAWIKWGENT